MEVIIIDNGSQDGTIELVENKFSRVQLIKSEKNLGFAAANNIGFDLAIANSSTFVFLLNQDTIIYPDTLEKLIEVFNQNDKIKVVSPIHLNDRGDKLDKKFEEYISTKTCEGFISDMTLDKPKIFYEIEFVNAAAWLIKGDIKNEIGLFSKEFYHYGEDSNFLQRLKYHGYNVVITPFSKIHHLRELRKGKLSQKFIKKEININLKNILLNINISEKRAYFNILKYFLSCISRLEIKNGIYILTYSLANYLKIKKIKNRYQSKNNLTY